MAARQRAFEERYVNGRSLLSPPRFFDHPVDEVAALHTASHGFVLTFYRQDLSGGERAGLRRLEALAVAQKAPVLMAPRAQGPALVAIREGVQMTCSQAGPAQVARLRAFAATMYPSLKTDRMGPPT